MKLWSVIAFWVLSLSVSGDGILGLGQEIQIERFRTNGQTQAGDLFWVLSGEKAAMRGNVTELEGFQATFLTGEGRTMKLSSSGCRFLHSLRELKSDSALKMKMEGISISGIGYDVYLEQRLIRVRSIVRIVIPRGQIPRKLIEKEKRKP